MEKSKGFADLKIVDFGTTVTAPCATRVFADYGATVIKVESIAHVDGLRTNPPFKDGEPGLNRSGYFSNFNAGKYSLSLNMNKPKAVEIAKRLVKWADVVVEAFRPGIIKKWGFTYEDLKKVKPDIIMVSTNMLGQNGPHCQFRGYGAHGSVIAGWGLALGWPDRGATVPFGAYSDGISVRYVAIAILAALEYRRRTGKGQYIDNSQVECSTQFMSPWILDYCANQRSVRPQGNRDPNGAPHGAYRCQGEDRWCAISVFTEEEWKAFCEVLGNPPWTRDPQFTTLSDRKKNEEELDQRVESWTKQYSPEDITQWMQAKGVAAGIVQNSKDIFRDPQLEHRGHIKMLKQSEMGFHEYESFGFRLSKTPGEPRIGAPNLGEHTKYVCTKILGYSDEEFLQLTAEGILE